MEYLNETTLLEDLKKFMTLQFDVFYVLLKEFFVSELQLVETAAYMFRDEWDFGDTDIGQFLELGRGLLMKKDFSQKTWNDWINAVGTAKYPDIKSMVHIYATGATEADNGSGRVATVGCKIVSGLTQRGYTKAANWVMDCYKNEGYTVSPVIQFTEQDFNSPAIAILTAY
jgi:hypothetical protein